MNIAEHSRALEQLAKVKPGDILAVNNFRGRSWFEADKRFPQKLILMTVERLTPKRIVTQDGIMIELSTGRLIGAGTYQRAFVPSETEIRQAEEIDRLREIASWFTDLKLSNMTAEQLCAMKDAYDAVAPKDERAPA